MSVAMTVRAAARLASATATHPLPVHDVGDCEGSRPVREQLERRFDDQLGFGSRDQHRRRHLERQTPEFLLSERCRRAARGRRVARRALRTARQTWRLGFVRRDEIARGVPAERELGEQARVELGLDGADAGLSQRLPGSGDVLEDRGISGRVTAG